MKVNSGSLFILAILFSLTACKKKTTATHTDIYFAGLINKYHKITIHDNTLETAVYWKNGVLVQLTDSLKDARANTIAVDNNDVYVGGDIDDIATYWKNGIAKKLCYGSIHAIKIVGHDVYMAGVSRKKNWEEDMATYWKNGVATIIGPGRITSMTVKDNDIYMAGVRVYNNDHIGVDAATYWKNDTQLPLNDTTGGLTNANGLFLYDGDVYIAGFSDNNSGQNFAVYWKNGHIMPLAVPESASYGDVAISIFVQNGNLYACGDFHNVPVYWKNGIVHILANTGRGSFAKDIAVQGNDLYVAGSNQYLPAYWKNGTQIPLSKYNGSVNAMDIVSY